MEKKIAPDLPVFIQNLEQQFNNPIPGGLKEDTVYRDLEEWTSMQALVVLSSFDWDYGVIVSSAELWKTRTIGDLFQLVTKKIS